MPGDNEWNENLGDICKDCGICFYGWCCTPCLFGENANKIDDSSCFGMCCLYCLLTECYVCFIPHMMKRQKLREKYNLKENPCGDCPTTFFCGPCALCQEARELKGRLANVQNVSYKPGGGPAIVTQPANERV